MRSCKLHLIAAACCGHALAKLAGTAGLGSALVAQAPALAANASDLNLHQVTCITCIVYTVNGVCICLEHTAH